MAKPIFKPYNQNQIYILPPSIEEMIEEKHPVRVVNEIIEKINIKPLKAGYKVQISSKNQYIINYSIHQKPTDTTTLPEHIESHKDKYKQAPEVVIADAGYGSEANYQYMEENKIEGFVKYNHFDKEQKKQKEDKNPFATEKLYFNPSQDCYYCPMGQKMEKLGEAERLNSEQIH